MSAMRSVGYRHYLLIMKKLVLITLAAAVSSCGFFNDLKPGDSAPSVVMNPKKIKDAVPRVEPRSRGGNRSRYQVFGKWYKVIDNTDGYRERGKASWYGVKFHGNKTANGETYDMYKMTAAHKHLPLPSYVSVKNLDNGKSTIVRVNDRGPFHQGRIIDLSYAAATKLDILKKGTANVEIAVIDPKAWLAARKAKNKQSKQSKKIAATSVKTAGALKTAGAIKQAAPISPKTSANDRAAPSLLYLQVAALNSLSAAQSLQQRLLDQLSLIGGVHADTNVAIHPSQSSTTAGSVYRVRIGPLAGRQQLAALRDHRDLARFGDRKSVV